MGIVSTNFKVNCFKFQKIMHDLKNIRKEYRLKELDEKQVSKDPMHQFSEWMGEALQSEVAEPTASVLSTVSIESRPSSRVVLIKQISTEGFDFFTNQQSKKGRHLEQNGYASLLFFWPELERQVRIEGKVQVLSQDDSDSYFQSRPLQSQIGAWASPQSTIIPNRKTLKDWYEEFEEIFLKNQVKRPPHWGGYRLEPDLMEFWQGRESRLHDRIEYKNVNGKWEFHRLAP
jgi:pyridoxamine 5'-phosphate oxidase